MNFRREKGFGRDLLTVGVLSILPALFFKIHFLIFLSPIPLLYAFYVFGRRTYFITAILSLFLVTLSNAPMMILGYGLTTLLISLVFGQMGKQRLPLTPLLTKTIGLILLIYAATGLVVSKGQPYSYLHTKISHGLQSLPHVIDSHPTFQEVGKIHPEYLMNLKKYLLPLSKNADIVTTQFLQEILLGYLVSGLLLTLWLSVLCLKSLHISLTSTNLTRWKTPDILVWPFIAAAALSQLTVPVLSPLSKNIFTIALVVYFLQGLSIMMFYFKQRNFSLFQKNLGYVLLLVFPLLATSFGFFDLWIDFRKRITKKEKPSALTKGDNV